MFKGMTVTLGIWAAAGAAWAAAVDQNWPSWRGPLGNGVAPAANPPLTWSDTNHVKWKVKIPGRGTATPLIWGNQIFVQTAIPTGKKPAETPKALLFPGAQVAALPQAPPTSQNPPPPGEGQQGGRRRGPGGLGGSEKPTEVHQFALLCLDRATGKTLWQKAAREEVPHESHHRDHSFASHSPVLDGKHIYAWFGSRGLHCYDLNGNLKWSKDYGKLRTKNSFGEGNSPVLSGNTLVVNWDHEGDDFIVALDKETGKELWRQKRDEDTTWTTPLIVPYAGKTQVVVPASTKVHAYDLATGEPLWECGGLGSNVIPSGVAGHGLVYVTSGHQRPALLAIKLGRTGDLTGSDAIAWRLDKGTPYVPSPLLAGDLLYFLSRNDGRLSCYDAKTGAVHFDQQPLAALSGVYASPVTANGRIYLIGRNGASVVLKAADKLEVLATNKLEEKFDASPALAGNDLILRGHESLYCLADN